MFPYFSLLIPLDKCIFTIAKYPEKLTMYITNYLSFVFWEKPHVPLQSELLATKCTSIYIGTRLVKRRVLSLSL